MRICIIFLFALSICFCSCIRPGTDTTREVKTRDSLIFVKGDNVNAILNDSLIKLLLKLRADGKEPRIEYRNSPDSPTNLTIHLDDKGRLQADCKTDDQLIKTLIKEITELKKTTQVVKEVPQWMMWAMAGIILLLIILLIIFLIKR